MNWEERQKQDQLWRRSSEIDSLIDNKVKKKDKTKEDIEEIIDLLKEKAQVDGEAGTLGALQRDLEERRRWYKEIGDMENWRELSQENIKKIVSQYKKPKGS